jgi:hypothetical protein
LDEFEAAKIVEKDEVFCDNGDSIDIHSNVLNFLSKRNDVDAFFPLEVPHHDVLFGKRFERHGVSAFCGAVGSGNGLLEVVC